MRSVTVGEEAWGSSWRRRWVHFWMRWAGLSWHGRFATRLAEWCAPPHKARRALSEMNPLGYISTAAVIYHSDLLLGRHVFIDEGVVIFRNRGGGSIQLGDRSAILRHSVLETGNGGSLTLGSRSSIHPRCQLNAYKASIHIGDRVMIAPNCALYSYDHGMEGSTDSIVGQPLTTKGDIVIGDGAWLGVGVTVLSGVRIGPGAVIGAGSVVTKDVPAGAVAVGVPARVVTMRTGREDLSVD